MRYGIMVTRLVLVQKFEVRILVSQQIKSSLKWWKKVFIKWSGDGTGRHAALKMLCPFGRTGSSPVRTTIILCWNLKITLVAYRKFINNLTGKHLIPEYNILPFGVTVTHLVLVQVFCVRIAGRQQKPTLWVDCYD